MQIQQEGIDAPPVRELIGIFSVAVLMGIASITAMIYFIVHAVNNKKVTSDERLIWILVIIFANVLAFPVYWFMRIKNDKSTPPATQDFSSQTMAR